MTKFFVPLCLLALCPWAAAQAPVFEPMPEGSRDAYLGLGVAHRPLYDGASELRWTLDPLVHASWSNGLFIAGSQMGWHLSNPETQSWPRWNYGPLLNLRAPRNANGSAWFLDDPRTSVNAPPERQERVRAVGARPHAVRTGDAARAQDNALDDEALGEASRLRGMQPLSIRLEGGAFANLRWSPQWQLAQTLLTHRNRYGQAWTGRLDLVYTQAQLAAHHSLCWSIGLTFANAAAMRSDFGVDADEALTSGNAEYTRGGGWRDIHSEVRWNWALSPRWVLSSALQVSRWQGQAAESPLVEQSVSTRISTALVRRF